MPPPCAQPRLSLPPKLRCAIPIMGRVCPVAPFVLSYISALTAAIWGGLRLHVSVSVFHIISFYSPSTSPITCQISDEVDSNGGVVGAGEGTDNGYWLLRVQGLCVREGWLRRIRG